MRTIAAVLVALLILAPDAGAARKKPSASARKSRTKKRHARKPLVFTVVPSPEIEERVRKESDKAIEVLRSLSTSNLFDSPYLSAAVYYHDGFLGDFPDDKDDADPSRRIVARVGRELTPARKAEYSGLLSQYWCDRAFAPDAPSPAFVIPVPYEPPAPAPPASRSKRKRRARRRAANHTNAIDLFVDEGTPVVSATRGVVVLADRNWAPGEAFSTTSQKGGNSVVVFDPDVDRFLRYAHLDRVLVSAGDLVQAGNSIGTVGHTGLNASLPRHGRHVHFEINVIDSGEVRSLKAAELWSLIRAARAPAEVNQQIESSLIRAAGDLPRE